MARKPNHDEANWDALLGVDGSTTGWLDVDHNNDGTNKAHASRHKSGGSDPIALDELAAPTDVTTLNASTSAHGLLKKLSGTASDVFHGDGTYGSVTDAQLSTSDVTTNNASTSKHGFLKKLDNNAAHYMDGTGAWSTPSAGSTHVLNVLDYGAVGDGTVDDSAAIQAALDAAETNQGSDILFPITAGGGRYKIATGLHTSIQGTRLIGQGHPGTSTGQAKGSVQIIVANGITGLTLNTSGTHQTRGYALENLHFVAASGATTGNGILVQDCERMIFRDVTCSDFIAGFGLKLDGGTSGGSAQYAELLNFSAGDCLYGLWTVNAGPNGISMFGGYFAGQGTTPRSGSKAIYLQKGDTFRAYGVKVQGWETGLHIAPSVAVDPADHEIFGFRSEFNNIGIRCGSNTRKVTVVGGCFDNSLLTGGGSSIGVQIDSGAEDVTLIRPIYSGVTQHLVDSGTRTRTPSELGTISSAATVGNVIRKVPWYDDTNTLVGYMPVYDTITGSAIERVKEIDWDALLTNQSSLTLQVPAGGVALGNTVLLAVGCSKNATVAVSATDSRSNTYTVDKYVDGSALATKTPHVAILSAPVGTALQSGDTITISFSPNVNYPIVFAYEYTGMTATPADKVAGATGTSTAPSSGATASTTVARELVFSASFYGATVENFTPAAGYTELREFCQAGTLALQAQEKFVFATGAQTGSGTITSSDWASGVVTYKGS